jgi:hypothetical protein
MSREANRLQLQGKKLANFARAVNVERSKSSSAPRQETRKLLNNLTRPEGNWAYLVNKKGHKMEKLEY